MNKSISTNVLVSEGFSVIKVKIANDLVEIAGHDVLVANKKYFVAPSFKYIRVFELKGEYASFINKIKVTREVLSRTHTQEDFVGFIFEDIVPGLLMEGLK